MELTNTFFFGMYGIILFSLTALAICYADTLTQKSL